MNNKSKFPWFEIMIFFPAFLLIFLSWLINQFLNEKKWYIQENWLKKKIIKKIEIKNIEKSIIIENKKYWKKIHIVWSLCYFLFWALITIIFIQFVITKNGEVLHDYSWYLIIFTPTIVCIALFPPFMLGRFLVLLKKTKNKKIAKRYTFLWEF